MASENYKKWIVIAIAAVIGAAFIIAYMSTSPYKPVDTSDTANLKRNTAPPGPMIDRNVNTVTPVEELSGNANDPAALALLGDKYFESGDFSQAIEIYKKVLELNPQDIDTFNDLGLAYYYTKNGDLAIETLKKGTEVMPSFQRVWLSLGFVLMSMGRNDEAKPVLQKTVALDPSTDVGQEAMRMMSLIK